MRAERDLLALLGDTPFLDRLEAAALSGWSRGAAYQAMERLGEAGLVAPLPHGSELIATTQRYSLTAAGLRRLADEEGRSLPELLRARPLTAHWRRLLLERLDAVAAVYRLASAIAGESWPLRFRWYRAQPMDAAIGLPDGRSLFLVRQGGTADRTSFAKRLWRLREGPRPGAYLVLVPDAVRLRHTARLMAQASALAFLALERDAVAGSRARVWRSAAGSPWLSLDEVITHVGDRRAWPREEPLARAPVPRDLRPAGLRRAPGQLLPALLKPAEKRVLGLVADWPWIEPDHLAGLLGVSGRRVAQILHSLEEAALATRVSGRLVLSDRGLALLARRDRSAVHLALRRWSAEPLDSQGPLAWRSVLAGAAASSCGRWSTPPGCTGFSPRSRSRRGNGTASSSSSTRPTAPRATSATAASCTRSTPMPSASWSGRASPGPSSLSGSAAPSGPPPWPPASRPTCATTPPSAPPTITGSVPTCSSSSTPNWPPTTSCAWPPPR